MDDVDAPYVLTQCSVEPAAKADPAVKALCSDCPPCLPDTLVMDTRREVPAAPWEALETEGILVRGAEFEPPTPLGPCPRLPSLIPAKVR